MTVENGAAMVMASAAFVAKLFPQTRPAEALRELYRQEPEIARTFPPLRPTLTYILTATATGLAASRPWPGDLEHRPNRRPSEDPC